MLTGKHILMYLEGLPCKLSEAVEQLDSSISPAVVIDLCPDSSISPAVVIDLCPDWRLL